jgi:hypothetical protein
MEHDVDYVGFLSHGVSGFCQGGFVTLMLAPMRLQTSRSWSVIYMNSQSVDSHWRFEAMHGIDEFI